MTIGKDAVAAYHESELDLLGMTEAVKADLEPLLDFRDRPK